MVAVYPDKTHDAGVGLLLAQWSGRCNCCVGVGLVPAGPDSPAGHHSGTIVTGWTPLAPPAPRRTRSRRELASYWSPDRPPPRARKHDHRRPPPSFFLPSAAASSTPWPVLCCRTTVRAFPYWCSFSVRHLFYASYKIISRIEYFFFTPQCVASKPQCYVNSQEASSY